MGGAASDSIGLTVKASGRIKENKSNDTVEDWSGRAVIDLRGERIFNQNKEFEWGG